MPLPANFSGDKYEKAFPKRDFSPTGMPLIEFSMVFRTALPTGLDCANSRSACFCGPDNSFTFWILAAIRSSKTLVAWVTASLVGVFPNAPIPAGLPSSLEFSSVAALRISSFG